MSHPILLPLIVLPHIAVPAGILYLIYLDNKETISRVRAAQSHARSRRQMCSKLANFIRANPPSKPRTRILLMIGDRTSFNVHSPMHSYARDNKHLLFSAYIDHQYRIRISHKIKKTPMRNLATSPKFQLELENALYYARNRRHYKSLYSYDVVPKIATQHGVFTSKFARFIRDHIWYSSIYRLLRERYSDNMGLGKMEDMH